MRNYLRIALASAAFVSIAGPCAAAEPLALHERIRTEYAAATADLSEADLSAIATYLERVQALSEEMNQALYRQTEAD